MKHNRRDFFKLGSLGLSALLTSRASAQTEALAESQNSDETDLATNDDLYGAAGFEPRRLSWRSMRDIGRQLPTDRPESYFPRAIEGEIPKEINGNLFRLGPGSKKVFGRKLGHYFDGDAVVTKIELKNGEAKIQTRFVETPERKIERDLQTMVFPDFGTRAPNYSLFRGYKNPPSISLLPFGKDILALSESTHPVKLRIADLEASGLENFQGSLPDDVSFCAHPKTDNESGDIYFFGTTKSLRPALVVYRIKNDSSVKEVSRVRLGGYYLVHDLILTPSYVVLLVPSVKIGLARAILTIASVSELLNFEPKRNMRAVIVRKDGSTPPAVLSDLPGKMVFHHVRAKESSDHQRIELDTVLIDDFSIFESFKAWARPKMTAASKSEVGRFVFDLKARRTLSYESVLKGSNVEFPCVDPTLSGAEVKAVYLSESNGVPDDQLALNTLVKLDLETKATLRTEIEPEVVFGEAVVVQKKWIAHLGYDGKNDETFLDLRSAADLSLAARVRFGRFLPIGFHGCYVQNP